MTLDQMKAKLVNTLSSRRYMHSLNVMNTAVKLAEKYGESVEKAAIAGLLHDCARDIKREDALLLCEKYCVKVDKVSNIQPELLHGPLGSAIAADRYAVSDESVLKAIYTHTTGREGMTLLEKLIFIADYIEPNRSFPGVNDVRKVAFTDINQAMQMSLDSTIKHVISKGALLHPDTILARNDIMLQYGCVNGSAY